MDEDEEIMSVTPPRYSFMGSFRTIRKKGLVQALEDREQGPHVHLTLLLITVVVVSVMIILISQFI